jgi:hypothetical protein
MLENCPTERVKITDFGLARAADDASLSQIGIVPGTPLFMAPEQAKGETLDHRADLFSLGSVLYTMCTGRPPFRATSTLAVLKRVAEDTPRPIPEIIPEVPPWLCDLIARLHAKKPEDRFATARDVANLLAQCLAELQQHSQVRSLASPTPTPSPTAVRAPSPRRRSWVVAAAILVLGVLGLGVTEATGVTNVRGTVIRLFSSEGTLIVEVDDPGVSVTIDGEEMIITGTGAKEIRLKPGQYKVMASKDGKTVREEVIRVERNGKQVVRVSREAPPGQGNLAAAEWEKSVAALPAGEQVKAVLSRLKRLNPEFDGTIEPTLENDRVVRLAFSGSGLQDISAVRALPGLRAVIARNPVPKLADLSPLRGMDLTELVLHQAAVSDLSPLTGMKLSHLDCTAARKLADLSPLQGMPLKMLSVPYTQVKDLSPLKGMKLEWLNCDSTAVSDLSRLEGIPLTTLHLQNTQVSDLKPLNGMALTYLDYTNTLVSDIATLKGMPLKELRCNFQPARDAVILRSIKTLEIINDKPAAEFWKAVDQK